MSCNGCRVLRKGCKERCILRSCLHWISSPEAQANATLFLAKFFGRSDLMSLISGVPEPRRPALFQSLLFEACGRTVNPVNGSVGLLWSGNWQVCQAAVETVLAGGTLRPLTGIDTGRCSPNYDESSESLFSNMHDMWSPSKPSMRVVGKQNQSQGFVPRPALDTKWIAGRSGKSHKRGRDAMSFMSEESDTTSLGINGGARKKLLNLFV